MQRSLGSAPSPGVVSGIGGKEHCLVPGAVFGQYLQQYTNPYSLTVRLATEDRRNRFFRRRNCFALASALGYTDGAVNKGLSPQAS
jgi:hypothetical protein